jgi:hypothetical protein
MISMRYDLLHLPSRGYVERTWSRFGGTAGSLGNVAECAEPSGSGVQALESMIAGSGGTGLPMVPMPSRSPRKW